MSEDNLQELKIEGGCETSTSEENAGILQTLPSNEIEGRCETSTLEENAGILQTLQSNAEKSSESPPNKIEINQQVNEIFEWIETKIELLKIMKDSNESDTKTTDKNEKDCTKEARNATLKEIMEDIHKIYSKESAEPTNCISEEVTKMLDMLQDTTMELLDTSNPSEKRCGNIKILATLIQHLTASVGTRVTPEEVQKQINGKRLLDLYSEVENSREPVLMKMVTTKKYIGQGLRKTRNILKKCKRQSYAIDDLVSGYSTSANLRRTNEKLKEVAKESENLLIRYADSIGYLATKTKHFFSLKQDSERIISSFMTKEIPDLYKTKV